MATVFETVRDVPSYFVAPVFTFLGVVLTLFFPRIKWSVEKKRELRKHRRKLIAQWQVMVADVSTQLDRLEQGGTSYHLGDVLRILERHAAYASFKSTYDHYDRSGIRGVKFRFARSRLRQQLTSAWKPRRTTMVGTPHPEYTVMAGSHLPARLHLTIRQIAEIERWWKLHK